MANTDFDTLIGELQISERPGSLCYGKPWDFVGILTKILKVSFPVNRNNKFVVIGHETPAIDDQDKMWARFTSSRVPLGWFTYVKGKWRRFYTAAPGEVRWFIGDSTKPPDGWQTIDENVSGISNAILDKLKILYVEDTPGHFVFFAARYIGY